LYCYVCVVKVKNYDYCFGFFAIYSRGIVRNIRDRGVKSEPILFLKREGFIVLVI